MRSGWFPGKSEVPLDNEGTPPLLLVYLFGDTARTAERAASARLLRWCRAFDEWLAQVKSQQNPQTLRMVRRAWRRLLGQYRKPPWELTPQDIKAHFNTMHTQGYSASTMCSELSIIRGFYRWCSKAAADPQCEAGFNPAQDVRRKRRQTYSGVRLLSRGELARLLQVMQADLTPLGRRDCSFTMLRLSTGVPLGKLQQLTWGQVEQDAAGAAWVRWREGAEPQPLDGEAWGAIRAALQAGGRLDGMKANDYIFTPLAKPGKPGAGRRAEDWQSGKYLAERPIDASLELYARAAGINMQKLSMTSLRWTAVKLRMEAGARTDELKSFMDSRTKNSTLKWKLGQLPSLPLDEAGVEGLEGDEVHAPDRNGHQLKPGDGLVHGLYANRQPPEAVARVLGEQVHGIEEQIIGLRELGRLLLEQQAGASRSHEVLDLAEAYSQAAARLAELVRGEREMESLHTGEQWSEQLLAAMDQFASEQGQEPASLRLREQAIEKAPVLEAADRRLLEEIAALRYVLRNVLRLASECAETAQLVRLADVYGLGCSRLVKLLRVEKGGAGRLEAYLKEQLDQALDDVTKELA